MYWFAYGEIGVAIGQAYLFGMIMGAFQLLVIWIDYSSYASMNYCTALLVVICASMELLMLFMNANDGGEYQERIYEDSSTKGIFFTMCIFAAAKLVGAWQVHSSFKKEYMRQNPDQAQGNGEGMFGSDDDYRY